MPGVLAQVLRRHGWGHRRLLGERAADRQPGWAPGFQRWDAFSPLRDTGHGEMPVPPTKAFEGSSLAATVGATRTCREALQRELDTAVGHLGPSDVTPATPTLDQQTRRQLEALGYLDGAKPRPTPPDTPDARPARTRRRRGSSARARHRPRAT